MDLTVQSVNMQTANNASKFLDQTTVFFITIINKKFVNYIILINKYRYLSSNKQILKILKLILNKIHFKALIMKIYRFNS